MEAVIRRTPAQSRPARWPLWPPLLSLGGNRRRHPRGCWRRIPGLLRGEDNQEALWRQAMDGDDVDMGVEECGDGVTGDLGGAMQRTPERELVFRDQHPVLRQVRAVESAVEFATQWTNWRRGAEPCGWGFALGHQWSGGEARLAAPVRKNRRSCAAACSPEQGARTHDNGSNTSDTSMSPPSACRTSS
jgi:hypothetical protein